MKDEQNITEEQMFQQDCTIKKQSSSPLKDFINGKVNFIHREQTNNISFFFKTLSKAFFLFHIVIAQQMTSGQNSGQFFSNLLQLFYSGSSLIITLQITSVLLKIILIESVYVDAIAGHKIIGFQWLNQKVLSSFNSFIEVDLTLSAYLLLFNWQQNIIIFLCSFIMTLAYTVYLQNYLFRKDAMYMSSTFHNILLQSFIFLSYIVNAIFLNSGSYQFFCLFHSIIGIIFFIWFFKWGRNLYFRSFCKDMVQFMVSIYSSLIIVILHNMIENMPIMAMTQISKFAITFIVVLGLIRMTNRKYTKIGKRDLKGKMKSYELYILEILQNSFEDVEDEQLYFGYLNFHTQEECLINCPFLQKQMFDPMLKMKIKPKQFSNQRESCYKCLLKCLYERNIKLTENKQILLHYCEFLYNEMGNLYVMMTYLEQLNNFNLNIIDLTKISKLKLLAQQENKRLNSELYENKLGIEDIIQAQRYFEIIKKDILEYLHNTQIVWCNFQEDALDISSLKQKMIANFQLIDQITKNWKNISKFFNCQKHWKYVYLNFMLFIKNQKIKLKDMDQINILSTNRDIFQSQKIFLEETKDISSLVVQSIMFDPDSFCIRTIMEKDQLIITDVSKNFYRNSLYTKEEIKECQLNILMPEQIRQSHSKAVVEWIQSGLISNDSSYNISFTSFLDKEHVPFPIIKYYKAHYNIEKGLEFICLLKINERPEIIEGDEMSSYKWMSKQAPKQKKQYIRRQNIDKQFKQVTQLNSLSLQSNIFIKDEMLQPPKNLKQIQFFKILSRIFIFTILISIIVLSQITLSDTNNLNSYGNQYINFMTMYRFPMVLATNYMKSFLNVGNQTKINSQIATATSSMLAASKQTITMKTMFDPTLNLPSNYAPYYNYSDIQGMTYNQIDLFYQIVSDITSLNILPINRTGTTFRHFNSYLKPSYDTMMNSTKIQLHLTFLTIFQQMKMKQLGFMIAQSVLFCLFVVIIFFSIHTFIQKMKNIMFILGDFSINDINKILSYWNLIRKSFHMMFKQANLVPKAKNKSQISKNDSTKIYFQQAKEKVILNKKAKKVLIGKNRQKEQLKFRFYIVISMIIIIALTISIEIQMIFTLSKLQDFEEAGFYFLRYFPTGPINGYGCMEKYYSLQYPQQIQFNPNRYSDVMSSNFLFGNFDYIGQIVDDTSPYYLKQKNYFFGRPCTYNPAVLISVGINVSKCETISNGTFKQGVSTFIRYGSQVAQNYMKGKILLTSAQLDELTLSLSVQAAFVLDAIMTWQQEFTSRIITQQQFNATISIIIASIIFVLHLIINEFIISRKIKSDFQFVCKMYEFYVPEFILINEKVLKQKFVLQGLIINE